METHVVVVLGPANSGKTSFIKSLTLSRPICLSKQSSTRYCTAEDNVASTPEPEVLMYQADLFEVGQPVVLVDTPPLSTEKHSDADTLRHVVACLSRVNRRVDSILYIQRIINSGEHDIDMAAGNAMELCDLPESNGIKVVGFVTTYWDTLSPFAVNSHLRRWEKGLLNRIAFAEERGIRTHFGRLFNTVESSLGVMDIIRPHVKAVESMVARTSSEVVHQDHIRAERAMKWFERRETGPVSETRDPRSSVVRYRFPPSTQVQRRTATGHEKDISKVDVTDLVGLMRGFRLRGVMHEYEASQRSRDSSTASAFLPSSHIPTHRSSETFEQPYNTKDLKEWLELVAQLQAEGVSRPKYLATQMLGRGPMARRFGAPDMWQWNQQPEMERPAGVEDVGEWVEFVYHARTTEEGGEEEETVSEEPDEPPTKIIHGRGYSEVVMEPESTMVFDDKWRLVDPLHQQRAPSPSAVSAQVQMCILM